MASNVEEDYDSDTELVPDYDMVDLNDFKLVNYQHHEKIDALMNV